MMCAILTLLGLLTILVAALGWIFILIVVISDFWRVRKQKKSLAWQAFRKTWVVCAIWVMSCLLWLALLNLGKMTECYWWHA